MYQNVSNFNSGLFFYKPIKTEDGDKNEKNT